MPYFPHTADDIRLMLQTIGVSDIENLFLEIPSQILHPKIDLPDPLSEEELREEVNRLGQKNRPAKTEYLSFVGGGAYERIIPSIIDPILSRSEFLTSYTPYQAEVSQGTLQFIFEFQSLIAALTGLEVANASMYDGASALAEAALMAMRVTRKRKVLYASTIHPRWKQTLITYLEGIQAERIEIPEKNGVADVGTVERAMDDETAALVLQHPNFFGYLEEVDRISGLISERPAFWIQASDPVALGFLAPPGELGADIAVGELQSLGIPLSFGGPYAGYFASRSKYVRQMPGRIVGKTTDIEGKTGYVLTLQTREQHIRRDKATSNICTNQSLCALASTLYLASLGSEGLQEVARRNFDKAHYLEEALTKLPGVRRFSEKPFFNEFTLVLPKPAREIASELKSKGILAGIHDPRWTGDEKRLILCVTETKKREELDRTAEAFAKVLGG